MPPFIVLPMSRCGHRLSFFTRNSGVFQYSSYKVMLMDCLTYRSHFLLISFHFGEAVGSCGFLAQKDPVGQILCVHTWYSPLWICVRYLFQMCVYAVFSTHSFLCTQDFRVPPKTIRSAADRVFPVKLKDTEPEFTADIWLDYTPFPSCRPFTRKRLSHKHTIYPLA